MRQHPVGRSDIVLTLPRYTIAWKESLPGTDLDGVEYQCLPSGLHSVREDLVYFIHGTYAGVSAFVQEEADSAHRNASFVAVGALVPLSYGRLGKSWEHAEDLRLLARATVKDLENKEQLDEFWKKHGRSVGSSGTSSPTAKRFSLPGSLKRKRALSDSTGAFGAEQSMPRDHPALSMTALITTFGPLIFPLYREALLRRRILLLGSTPVQRTCNFGRSLCLCHCDCILTLLSLRSFNPFQCTTCSSRVYFDGEREGPSPTTLQCRRVRYYQTGDSQRRLDGMYYG